MDGVLKILPSRLSKDQNETQCPRGNGWEACVKKSEGVRKRFNCGIDFRGFFFLIRKLMLKSWMQRNASRLEDQQRHRKKIKQYIFDILKLWITCKHLQKNNVRTKKNTISNNYIYLFFFPIFHPAQLRPGPASVSVWMKLQIVGGDVNQSRGNRGHVKLCINESVSTPCTPVFSPLHTLSALFSAAGEHRRVGRRLDAGLITYN